MSVECWVRRKLSKLDFVEEIKLKVILECRFLDFLIKKFFIFRKYSILYVFKILFMLFIIKLNFLF